MRILYALLLITIIIVVSMFVTNTNGIEDIKYKAMEMKIKESLDNKIKDNTVQSYSDVKCYKNDDNPSLKTSDCKISNLVSISKGFSFSSSSVYLKNIEKSIKFFDQNGTELSIGESATLDLEIKDLRINDKPILFNSINSEQLPDSEFLNTKLLIKNTFDLNTSLELYIKLEKEENLHNVKIKYSFINEKFLMSNEIKLINYLPENNNFTLSNLNNFGSKVVVSDFIINIEDKNEFLSSLGYSYYLSKNNEYVNNNKDLKEFNYFFGLNENKKYSKQDFNKEFYKFINKELSNSITLYSSVYPNLEKIIDKNELKNKIKNILENKSKSITIESINNDYTLIEILTALDTQNNKIHLNIK